MTRIKRMYAGLVLVLGMALMATSPLMATDSKMDGKSMGSDIRASKFIDMDIQNGQGKEVGEVEDIVLDANTGEIRYVAVEYESGFMDLGEKMFAVPFKAFTYKPGDHVLILNVTQQQLEGAQGFNEDQWPNSADANFTQDLDKRYGVDSMHQNKTN